MLLFRRGLQRRAFATQLPEELIPNVQLLQEIRNNQEAILRHRREDTIRGFTNILDDCTSFSRAMDTSRRALVFCGVEDAAACKQLIEIEKDNPMLFRSLIPTLSLATVVCVPAVVVGATYDPDGFFLQFCNAVQHLTSVDIRVHSWDTMEPLGFVAMSFVGLLVSGMTMGHHIRRLGIRPPGYRLEQLQVRRVVAKLEALNVDEQGKYEEKLPLDLIESIAMAIVRLDTIIYTWLPSDKGVSVRMFPWEYNRARVNVDFNTPRGLRGLAKVHTDYLYGENLCDASKKSDKQ